MSDSFAGPSMDFGYGVPIALVFADGDAGMAAWRDCVEYAGCRIGAVLSIEAAGARLDEQSSVAAVLVDVTRDGGGALDRLLERLDQRRAAGAMRARYR